MDSSLLLMEPYGFIEADDIRYHKTVEASRKPFSIKDLCIAITAKTIWVAYFCFYDLYILAYTGIVCNRP